MMTTNAKVGWIFPGQGSQHIGMGKDLYHSSIAARDVMDEVDEILGNLLTTTMFEGPIEKLTETKNTQPAILSASFAIWKAIEEADGEFFILPPTTAGHSIGEYPALLVSGVLSLQDTVTLVMERSRLMQVACEERPGGMAAIIGLDEVTAQEICRESGAQIAVINSKEQIVLAGDHHNLAMAIDIATARGAKKAQLLMVAGGFHSGLMSPAQNELSSVIDSLTFNDPFTDLIGNVDGKILRTSFEVKDELKRQLTSCVQWNKTIKVMIANGTREFVSVGPGNVLPGIIRRIDRNAKIRVVNDQKSIMKFVAT